ncbi:MAG: tRNA-dihydrouridine synthase, partial [Gammaproteobacteria bacterium]|nr:tRNA-dihydrouridine synthase [Gammaproteobacteria bacterium]
MKQDFYSLFSVAPMMEWTDRHYRYFARLITKESTLYTEMITTGAILHGQSDRFLSFDESEHPVVVQLGGSDPVDLAKSAKI